MISSMKSSNKGVALMMVVVIMLTVALIGASLVEFVASVNTSSQNVVDETKARYLAEAGIAYSIYLLRTQAGKKEKKTVLEEQIGPNALGDGAYTVLFNYREAMITSTGTVNGVSKKLQLQYDVF